MGGFFLIFSKIRIKIPLKDGSPSVFQRKQVSGFNPVYLEIRPENWIVNVH